MPSPTLFSYSLMDKAGVKGSCNFFVAYDAATETVAAVLAAASALGGMLDAVTGAVITEFNVKVNALPDPAWKTAAIANLDMEQTLLENFSVVDSQYVQSYDVPCLRDSLITADKKPIIATGAIATLNAAIISGTGLTGVSVNNKFLLELTGLVDAQVSFRKHRRQRKSISLVTT